MFERSSTTKRNRTSTADADGVVDFKGWRFPLSRLHLWDRQVVGDVITLTPSLFFPETTLSSTVLKTIGQCQGDTPVEFAIEWSRHLNGSQHLHLAYQSDSDATGTPLPTTSWSSRCTDTISCQLSEHASEEAETTAIGRRLRRQFDDVFEDTASQLKASLLFPLAFTYRRLNVSGEGVVEGYLASLDCSLSLSSIRMKNVAQLPLTATLKSGMRSDTPPAPQTGYLSMDTCRRLIPLLSGDTCVQSMTTVGIWVSGISEIENPLVLAACLRFHSSSSLKDKAMIDGAFLLLYCGYGDYSLKLFECSVSDASNLRLYGCRVFRRNTDDSTKIRWKSLTPFKQQEPHLKQTPPPVIATSKGAKHMGCEEEATRRESSVSVLPPRAAVKRPRVQEQVLVTEEIPEKNAKLLMPFPTFSTDGSGIIGLRMEDAKSVSFTQPTAQKTELAGPVEIVDSIAGAREALFQTETLTAMEVGIEELTANGTTSVHTAPAELPSAISEDVDSSVEASRQLCLLNHPRQSCSCSCPRLEREVEELRDKVAVLEHQIQMLMRDQQLEQFSTMSSPTSPTTQRSPTADALALIPVDCPPKTTDWRSGNPCSRGRYAEDGSKDSEVVASTGEIASIDLSRFLSYPMIDVTFNVDAYDPELEMLSRKYLGKGFL